MQLLCAVLLLLPVCVSPLDWGTTEAVMEYCQAQLQACTSQFQSTQMKEGDWEDYYACVDRTTCDSGSHWADERAGMLDNIQHYLDNYQQYSGYDDGSSHLLPLSGLVVSLPFIIKIMFN